MLESSFLALGSKQHPCQIQLIPINIVRKLHERQGPKSKDQGLD